MVPEGLALFDFATDISLEATLEIVIGQFGRVMPLIASRNIALRTLGQHGTTYIGQEALWRFCSSQNGMKSIELELFQGDDAVARLHLSGVSVGRMLVAYPQGPARLSECYQGVIEQLSRAHCVGYGYEFSRSERREPVLMAAGISEVNQVEKVGESELDSDQAWFNERVLGFGARRARRYLVSGMIRDVFPVNYLNKSHSQHRYGPGPLVSEIRARALGDIAEIGNDCFRWTVPDALLVRARASLSLYCIA